jgi:pimeloyl-ACP methyl ester carboxylesterase
MPKPMNDVIVLLPGILGSVLKRDGRDVWALSGGAIGRSLLTLGKSINDLVLKDRSTDPNIAADGVTADRLLDDVHLLPGLWKIDGYTKVANSIKAEFDVQEGVNFFRFPYDWRRSNAISAQQLAAKAQRWLADWRQRPGKQDAKLILIGHSMGGLVSRYFLEVLDGWKETRALITFGTPYRGSLNALGTLSNGLRVGFGPLGLDLSPFARSLVGLYELLPIYRCYDPGNGDLGRVYEVPGIPNLDIDRAKEANAFHRKIESSVDTHLKDNTYLTRRYAIHAVVGRKQATNQSARLDGGKVTLLQTFSGRDMEGDGTVPLVSATPIEMPDGFPRIFADGQHASLQNLDPVLVNVGGILSGLDIHAATFSATVGRGGIPLRLGLQDAYPATQPIRMTIEPGQDFVDLEASLVDVDTGNTVQNLPVGAPGEQVRNVAFNGLPPGTYRVRVEGGSVTPVTDVFVVF